MVAMGRAACQVCLQDLQVEATWEGWEEILEEWEGWFLLCLLWGTVEALMETMEVMVTMGVMEVMKTMETMEVMVTMETMGVMKTMETMGVTEPWFLLSPLLGTVET